MITAPVRMPAGCDAVFVGLGANLGPCRETLERAVQELSRFPSTRVLAVSQVYRTSPLGPVAQPDYLNAVARLATALEPHALLTALHDIEARLGRVRDGLRWGPRSLDLDLLLYGDEISPDPALRLPHPELHRRAFALIPLAEIAPEITVPGYGPVRDLCATLAEEGVECLGPLSHEGAP